jgi:hypothetical protein
MVTVRDAAVTARGLASFFYFIFVGALREGVGSVLRSSTTGRTPVVFFPRCTRAWLPMVARLGAMCAVVVIDFCIDVAWYFLGLLDLALTRNNFVLPKFYWFLNAGGSPPSYTQYNMSTVNATFGLDFADVDLDGDIDICMTTSDSPNGSMFWLENDGAGTSFTSHTVAIGLSYGTTVLCRDFDLDGDVDVLVGMFTGSNFYINTGANSLVFQRSAIAETGIPEQFVSLDVNNDGRLDVVGSMRLSNVIKWFGNPYYVTCRSLAAPVAVNVSACARVLTSSSCRVC